MILTGMQLKKEMILNGKMHGYMRMYWVRKLSNGLNVPKKAFQIVVTLNNKYELDGRDPNGFAGVAWCFGKHDRAWKERGNLREGALHEHRTGCVGNSKLIIMWMMWMILNLNNIRPLNIIIHINL